MANYEQPDAPLLRGANDAQYHGAVIVTESGADLLPEQIKEYSVYVLPMHICIGTENLDDGAFPPRRIFDDYHTTGKIPTTSAVAPEEYAEMFRSLRKKYPHQYILHLCYSAVTTATWHNALLGSEEIDGVIHIDTKQVSGGQGAIVVAVAQWLLQNFTATADAIVHYAQSQIDCSHFAFMPSALQFLKAGGRLSNAQYVGASILGIKPLVEVIDGKLVCTKKLRGKMDKVCLTFVDDFLSRYHLDKKRLILLYSDGMEDVLRRNIVNHLQKQGCTNLVWSRTGGVISCHGGPCAFGFGGFESA